MKWNGCIISPHIQAQFEEKKTRLLNSKNRTWQNSWGFWLELHHLETLSDQSKDWVYSNILAPPRWSPSGIPTTHLTAQGEALGMNFQIMQMDLVALVQNQGVVMFVAFVCWQEPETRAGSQRINDGAQPQRIKSILVREKKTQLTCLQCKALWNHFRYR